MWIVVKIIETHELIRQNILKCAIGEFSADTERLVMEPWEAPNFVKHGPGGILLICVSLRSISSLHEGWIKIAKSYSFVPNPSVVIHDC